MTYPPFPPEDRKDQIVRPLPLEAQHLHLAGIAVQGVQPAVEDWCSSASAVASRDLATRAETLTTDPDPQPRAQLLDRFVTEETPWKES